MSGVNARRREEELENRVKILEGAIYDLIGGEMACVFSLSYETGLNLERCKEIVNLLENKK